MNRCLFWGSALACTAGAALAQQARAARPIELTSQQRQELQAKIDRLEAAIQSLKAKRGEDPLVADVEVYAKAGKWLLEFPEDFSSQEDVTYTSIVLDRGMERANQLLHGEAPWVTQKGRKIHGFYSDLDGSVQPYGLTVPASYDGVRPVRLYVWLHGRAARLSEGNFIYTFTDSPPAPASTQVPADVGQIQLDVYGRWNSGYKYAGETDVFEAIAAVEKRYKIDPSRIVLRGFSLGGEGAWNLALHNPDRWVAAEIGAGTWPRRYLMSGFPPYQQAVLHIWENMTEWALNGYNLPIAAHDGDSDTQVASIPPPPPGTPTRGQLESSIRIREQLAKEGFPSEGDPNALMAKGTPDLFLISEHTGHGTSPAVRQRLNAFLKEWGDRGQVSPAHIRFLTYTTRYNRCYWVSLDGLEKHYERAEVNAQRSNEGERYQITTRNLTRLTLRETGHAAEIEIDGQTLRVKPAPAIALEKNGGVWRVAHSTQWSGLHKTHALQGPIDDAFLDPFLLVRPTGTPWNELANRQALATLSRFESLWARHYRAHPRVKDDKDVTPADFAKYHVVLFGDPGSNRWIARVNGKLPLRWTRETVAIGAQRYPAATHLPVLIYPNPLYPSHYLVLNSGLTIDEREYRADYGMPRLGDFAVLEMKPGADRPEVAAAGLFNEFWKLP
jgi:pimeloyl-ACP methyl ester carboxylesterase